MSKCITYNQIRIQPDVDYFYTVEDMYIDIVCEGLTISLWSAIDGNEKRETHVCIGQDAALAVADAIYKLFKKEND